MKLDQPILTTDELMQTSIVKSYQAQLTQHAKEIAALKADLRYMHNNLAVALHRASKLADSESQLISAPAGYRAAKKSHNA